MTSSDRLAVLLVICTVASLAFVPVTTTAVDVPVSGPGPFTSPNGPSVTFNGSADINFTDNLFDSNKVRLNTSKGIIEFSSAGRTNATIDDGNITGQWTNVTALDVNQYNLTVNPEDKSAFVVGGNAETLSVNKTRSLDDGKTDFRYSGPSGTSLVKLQGLPSNQWVAAVDADTGSLLDIAESDGAGNITFGSLDNSGHNVQMQSVSPDAPIVDNGSASPQGNPTVRYDNQTLSINISDQDFAEASDSVDVEFTVNNSVVGTKTLSSNGTASLQVNGLSEGTHSWSVNASDSYGEYTESQTFQFTVDHYDPQQSNPNPQGNISYEPTELNVSITDGDFPKDGDSLDVYFDLDGQSVGTDSLGSNGTASTTISGNLVGGDHNFSVAVQDQYGQWTNQTYQFAVPDTLFVYKEEKPTELVDNASVELRFYPRGPGSVDVFERNTSNGSINMTGLPVGQPFVVVADADGYLPRRIFLPSLYQSTRIYLLNDSKQYADVIFEIEDYSGRFPQSTSALEVQRALNGTWQTVLGDYFGANGQFPGQLRYNTRHRLVITNTLTGDREVLGTFTPLQSGEQTVTVSPQGSVSVAEAKPDIGYQPAATQVPERNPVQLEIDVDANDQTLTQHTVSIFYINQSSNTNVTLYQDTSQSEDGTTHNPSLNLTARGGGSLLVVTSWETSNGRTGKATRNYSVQETYAQQNSLLTALSGFVGLVAGPNQDAFTGSLAIVLTVVLTGTVAARLRLPTEMVGLVALGGITAFAIIGWLSYQLMFVGVVTWGAIAYLRRRY